MSEIEASPTSESHRTRPRALTIGTIVLVLAAFTLQATSTGSSSTSSYSNTRSCTVHSWCTTSPPSAGFKSTCTEWWRATGSTSKL